MKFKLPILVIVLSLVEEMYDINISEYDSCGKKRNDGEPNNDRPRNNEDRWRPRHGVMQEGIQEVTGQRRQEEPVAQDTHGEDHQKGRTPAHARSGGSPPMIH